MRGFCLEASGTYACFTRPEMKVERVSYDVITPSAARAIFEAILWKPAIQWQVTKIEVLAPIKWISVRRNEVGAVVSTRNAETAMREGKGSLGIYVEDERQQRAGLFLQDVKYRLHAYFDFIPPEKRRKAPSRAPAFLAHHEESSEIREDETEAKYAAMFERRARKGQCFNQPYLGCREFSANVRLADIGTEQVASIAETRDLGWMFYDFDYVDPSSPQPMFFHPHMTNGVILVPGRDSQKVRR